MKDGQWWDVSWNPVEGCSPISEGCERCWAQGFLRRFRKTTDIQYFPERLQQPLKWRKPRRVFVCSLSDPFHDQVCCERLDNIWLTMALSPQHTHFVLTKRPKNASMYLSAQSTNERLFKRYQLILPDIVASEQRPVDLPYELIWPLPNVFLGVTAENQQRLDERWTYLREIPTSVLWFSLEPLLGPIVLPNDFLSYGNRGWCVVGGETGPGARPMHPNWVRSIRDQCKVAEIQFFFKSWGSNHVCYGKRVDFDRGLREYVYKCACGHIWQGVSRCVEKRRNAGRMLDGRTWDEIPKRKHGA